MNINLVEKIELVHGAAGVSYCDNGFVFERMTAELSEFYSQSEAQVVRAQSPAGVRICFRSDTPYIGMRLNFGRHARAIYNVDILVDGMERMTFSAETPEDGLTFSAELPPGGEHGIEIFLPNMCECAVEELAIADGSTLEPLKYQGGRIIFIGDSITQGMTCSSPSRAYAALLAGALKRDFHNISVGGATMRREVGCMALDLKWNTAFVAYGVNDCNQGRPLDEFAADTRGMLEVLTGRAGSRVYMITPIPWLSAGEGKDVEQYREAIRRVAGEFPGVVVFEGTELVPGQPDFLADGCHPNDRGMEAYACSLLQKLQDMK